jgi:ABC-type nickel/cobalt efflux system permease component RcnA
MDDQRAKLFATDWDAWNNRWMPRAAIPLLVAPGVLLGMLFDGLLVSSELGQTLVMSLCIGVTVFVGLALLAVVD